MILYLYSVVLLYTQSDTGADELLACLTSAGGAFSTASSGTPTNEKRRWRSQRRVASWQLRSRTHSMAGSTAEAAQRIHVCEDWAVARPAVKALVSFVGSECPSCNAAGTIRGVAGDGSHGDVDGGDGGSDGSGDCGGGVGGSGGGTDGGGGSPGDSGGGNGGNNGGGGEGVGLTNGSRIADVSSQWAGASCGHLLSGGMHSTRRSAPLASE